MRKIAPPYRSKFEESLADDFDKRKIKFKYESEVLKYVRPKSFHKYTPDFILRTKSGKTIFCEAKGRLTAIDRAKMLLVRASNKKKDIRFIFMNASVKIRKGSKTTYGMWADKHEFKWCNKVIPGSWIKE